MSPSEHPVSRLFPDMDIDEYAILKLDIRDNGLKVPILLWQGQLIDGRHRLKACQELGIEPRFETVDCPEEELSGLVWSLNRVRRQLSHSQRAMIAATESWYSEPHRPKALKAPERDTSTTEVAIPVEAVLAEIKVSLEAEKVGHVSYLTQQKAANRYGVSDRHLRRAKAVIEADQTLAHKVHKGEITVSKALKEIDKRKNPPKVEPARDQPNLVHRDHLNQALEITVRLESLLVSITQYSRPPVPDEEAWGREVELKQRLTALCAMIPKLCINEVGESWNEA
jgi:hypothetical protein